jgi:hypothetical protein
VPVSLSELKEANSGDRPEYKEPGDPYFCHTIAVWGIRAQGSPSLNNYADTLNACLTPISNQWLPHIADLMPALPPRLGSIKSHRESGSAIIMIDFGMEGVPICLSHICDNLYNLPS